MARKRVYELGFKYPLDRDDDETNMFTIELTPTEAVRLSLAMDRLVGEELIESPTLFEVEEYRRINVHGLIAEISDTYGDDEAANHVIADALLRVED